MPSIILKKTFKIKPSGFSVAAEKSFSFHGRSATQELIANINQALQGVKYAKGATIVQFQIDSEGHFYAKMNHNTQKYNEEDVIVAILDVMEIMGWNFKFQYDSENHSVKVAGSSFTSRELFIFHKNP